jgi:hypothetical protein
MTDPIIAFPFLHPELTGPLGLPGVAFLDPGLAAAIKPGAYRPDNLPLSPAEAAAAVGQWISFGDIFKDPRSLAGFASAGLTGFAPDSSMALRKEITDRADPAKAAAAKEKENGLRAQTLLGLAYRIEENALELTGIDAKIGLSFDRLQKELGLAGLNDGVDYENRGCGDDEEFDLPGAPSVSDAPQLPPWRLVLEAMLFFLPPGCALVTADADVAASWDEFGANLAEPGPETLKALFPAGAAATGLKVGAAPGFALISRKTPAPDKPWLDAARTVIFLDPVQAKP